MSSTGTRKQRDVQARANESIIESDKDFIANLKTFSGDSDPIGGVAGQGSQSSPQSPAGNYLAREGDSMIGPIALGPPVDFTIEVDANNTINISPNLQNPQFTSNIQLDDSQTESSILDIISGAAFDGQILILRTITPATPYTINQGTAGNGGNIQTADGANFTMGNNQMIVLVFDESIEIAGGSSGLWRVLAGSGGGGSSGSGTGTFISAALSEEQLTNVDVGDHIEFDVNTPPTGADGGIVLQTGAGQLDGIFELKANKTYFLSAGINLESAGGIFEFVWYDITNDDELGVRTFFTSGTIAMNQPKNEIIFTPTTDVEVEVRIVAVSTSIADIALPYTFANIFEFSGITRTAGASSWKTPARAKSTEDIPNLAASTVTFDGVTLVEGNRVLLTDQDDEIENGIYDVGTVTASIAPLTRSSDFDTNALVVSETFIAIEQGALHKNALWHLITNNPIDVDTDDQIWDVFAPGTSGGPDMGGGEDGVDAAGEFVNDGRVGVSAAYLKIWEIIDITGNVPEQNMANMIYLPTNIANKVGRIFIDGLSNATKGGAFSDNYGVTWTKALSVTSNLGHGRMAYAPNLTTNGTLVMIRAIAGGTAATFAMQVSTDRGTSFSNVTLDFSNLGQNFQDVIWSEEQQLFVATSFFDATHGVYTSTNGSAWTRRLTPASSFGSNFVWNSIVWAPGLGKYYINGPGRDINSNTEFIESTNGTNWTGPTTNNEQCGTPSRIVWSEGQQKFGAGGALVFGGAQPIVEFSTDFITWVVQNPTNIQNGVDDIVWCPDISLWVIIGDNNNSTADPRIFWASNDGLTWSNFPINNFRTGASLGVSNARSEIAYAEEFGYFFGCNSGFGTGERFFRTSMKTG